MSNIWLRFDERLYEATVEAIRMFASENPMCELRCFFFDSDDPKYGSVGIAFDTVANNVRSVRELEQAAVQERAECLLEPDAWRSAEYHLNTPRLNVINTNSGDFEFPEYQSVDFPEWSKLTSSKKLPLAGPQDDDYMSSNVRLMFWRVTERLIKNNAFASLSLASPFVIGYGLHDQDESILRTINW